MSGRNSFSGLLLIVIGVIFLAARYIFNIELLNFEAGDFWPFIILLLGLMFEGVYLVTRSKPGLLVPGGILTTQGLLFLLEVATDWKFAAYTWPVYILSVAIGLFQLYLFGNKNKGLLIAVSILASIAVISGAVIMLELFFKSVDIGFVLPVMLIAGGLLIFFGRKPQANH